MPSRSFKGLLSIEAKIGLKPKVEPTYKCESFPWLKVVSIISMLGSIALTVLTAIAGQESTALLGIALLAITSGFASMLKGDYSLAVRFVNFTSVEEWSYNNGIAMMMLSNGILAILDTARKKLYLSKDFSIQGYPLSSVQRTVPRVKFTVFTKPISLSNSREFKRIKVLKGLAEVPSIKSEKEFMRVFGTFVETSIERRCLREMNVCIERLIKVLKEV